MEKVKVLVGCYRNWSTKTPSEKAKAYQEEAGNDYFKIKAELKAIAGHPRRISPTKVNTEQEQQMVRELQGVFCTSRYRSWRPWMEEIKKRKIDVDRKIVVERD
jgi:hypothetical protein